MKKCKEHGGPVTDLTELDKLVKKGGKNLKKYLRQEVYLQKLLHPYYAKERSELYRLNFLEPGQLAGNLTILLSAAENADTQQADVIFPTEEEMKSESYQF